MKVDMFLVNQFRKIGEGFFHHFLYTKRSSDKHVCDAKVPTRNETKTDHHVWQGNFFERLGF